MGGFFGGLVCLGFFSSRLNFLQRCSPRQAGKGTENESDADEQKRNRRFRSRPVPPPPRKPVLSGGRRAPGLAAGLAGLATGGASAPLYIRCIIAGSRYRRCRAPDRSAGGEPRPSAGERRPRERPLRAGGLRGGTGRTGKGGGNASRDAGRGGEAEPVWEGGTPGWEHPSCSLRDAGTAAGSPPHAPLPPGAGSPPGAGGAGRGGAAVMQFPRSPAPV